MAKEAQFTSREREVLALVRRGFTNKQIAKRLGTSEFTIRAHLSNMRRKSGTRNRTQLAMLKDSAQ